MGAKEGSARAANELNQNKRRANRNKTHRNKRKRKAEAWVNRARLAIAIAKSINKQNKARKNALECRIASIATQLVARRESRTERQLEFCVAELSAKQKLKCEFSQQTNSKSVYRSFDSCLLVVCLFVCLFVVCCSKQLNKRRDKSELDLRSTLLLFRFSFNSQSKQQTSDKSAKVKSWKKRAIIWNFFALFACVLRLLLANKSSFKLRRERKKLIV